MALKEKAVYISLGVPIFISISWVAENTIVAEAFKISVFDTETFHQSLVGHKSRIKSSS